jgi:hypothetical protein
MQKKGRNELKMGSMMRGNYGGLSENDERGVTNVAQEHAISWMVDDSRASESGGGAGGERAKIMGCNAATSAKASLDYRSGPVLP